jgi:hypothetical protein
MQKFEIWLSNGPAFLDPSKIYLQTSIPGVPLIPPQNMGSTIFFCFLFSFVPFLRDKTGSAGAVGCFIHLGPCKAAPVLPRQADVTPSVPSHWARRATSRPELASPAMEGTATRISLPRSPAMKGIQLPIVSAETPSDVFLLDQDHLRRKWAVAVLNDIILQHLRDLPFNLIFLCGRVFVGLHIK